MQIAGYDQKPVEEKHGRGDEGTAEALRMLDLFASVGVSRFDITHTDCNGTKHGFRTQPLAEACRSMPFLLRAALRRERNVIVRPHQPPAVLLVQLDDLQAAGAARTKPFALFTIETSPGSFQSWIAVRPGTDADFPRRLRKGAQADPSASGATRIAGSRNFKRRYAPAYPLVRIESARAGHHVGQQELHAAGLVAAPSPVTGPPASSSSRRMRGRWPSYQRCVERAPLTHGGDRPDISRADFTWCMTAIDWGWDVTEIAERLMEESEKAQQNGYDYAILTARNAALAVGRRAGHTSES